MIKNLKCNLLDIAFVVTEGFVSGIYFDQTTDLTNAASFPSAVGQSRGNTSSALVNESLFPKFNILASVIHRFCSSESDGIRTM